jgi:hypothetical protein
MRRTNLCAGDSCIVVTCHEDHFGGITIRLDASTQHGLYRTANRRDRDPAW